MGAQEVPKVSESEGVMGTLNLEHFGGLTVLALNSQGAQGLGFRV